MGAQSGTRLPHPYWLRVPRLAPSRKELPEAATRLASPRKYFAARAAPLPSLRRHPSCWPADADILGRHCYQTCDNRSSTALAEIWSIEAFVVEILFDLIPDSARKLVNERALSTISSVTVGLAANATEMYEKGRNLRKHQIEWHRKLALSLACLVLFLIGAPHYRV